MQTWLDEHNDEIKDRILLLKGLIAAQRRAVRTDGEFEWTIQGELRSLTLKATVQDDESIAYSAVFNGPLISDYEFLSGSTAAGYMSGSWTIKKPDGTVAVEVTWEKTDDGVLTVHRTHLLRGIEATLTRDATTTTITFSGPNRAGAVSWDRASKDGSFSVNGGTPVCWDYDADAKQLCEATCP